MLCRNNFSSNGRMQTEKAFGTPLELDNLSSGHLAAAVAEPNGTAGKQRTPREAKGKEIRKVDANGGSSSGSFSFHMSKDTRCCPF